MKTNTHHLDVSGEPEYLEKMQYLYDDKAVKTNTFIVGSCGNNLPTDYSRKILKLFILNLKVLTLYQLTLD